MATAPQAMILAAVAVAALAVQLAAAVDHPVGGSGAWDASGTSYNAWSAKQAFVQGDTMSFKYAASHDITEVTKAGYDACSGANPVKSYTGGATIVKLAAPGKRYFICSVPGHCAAGMKLEVTVAAAAVTAPAPGKGGKPRHKRSVAPTPAPAMAAPEPSSVPSTDGLPTVSTPTAAPASKSSDAASIGVLGAKAGMALAVGMTLALAI
ncbi:mavicyanin-like [Panicum miliaceum]|uniref:Mavicyanin-like n=1 Tax=Panicum miliaceum TaxID=4540 RepID=A0A3L6QTA9_PANMI|nr:mavicyanin-like [Panicum miliaceum]